MAVQGDPAAVAEQASRVFLAREYAALRSLAEERTARAMTDAVLEKAFMSDVAPLGTLVRADPADGASESTGSGGSGLCSRTGR